MNCSIEFLLSEATSGQQCTAHNLTPGIASFAARPLEMVSRLKHTLPWSRHSLGDLIASRNRCAQCLTASYFEASACSPLLPAVLLPGKAEEGATERL